MGWRDDGCTVVISVDGAQPLFVIASSGPPPSHHTKVISGRLMHNPVTGCDNLESETQPREHSRKSRIEESPTPRRGSHRGEPCAQLCNC